MDELVNTAANAMAQMKANLEDVFFFMAFNKKAPREGLLIVVLGGNGEIHTLVPLNIVQYQNFPTLNYTQTFSLIYFHAVP